MNLAEVNKEVLELHKIIGKNVKRIRVEKKYSQRSLSLSIGQESTTVLSQAELGKVKHFNIEQLYKISKVLDVDICEFFNSDQ